MADKSLGEILIKERKDQGLTQAALAKKLHMVPQQIQRYESQVYSSASLLTFERVAKALGIVFKVKGYKP